MVLAQMSIKVMFIFIHLNYKPFKFKPKPKIPEMNDNHRYFVQYMLKRGISTLEHALAFLKNVSKDAITNHYQLKAVVGEINREITKHSFKLVYDICEVTNQEVLVWINTKNDEISALQITFTQVELEYFQAILQEILTCHEHKVTFIVCLNMTSTLTGTLNRNNGQKLLEKWVRVGYFVNTGGYIYFGPRLILEFNAYLKSHCPDSTCGLCSELVFTGKQCAFCTKTLHSSCLSKYLERQNNCPCCHAEWIETETAITDNTNNDVCLGNGNDLESMEVTEEVPDSIYEDYSQLTKEYSNINQNYSLENGTYNSQELSSSLSNTRASTNFARLRTRRTTEEDLLEAGPSTRN